MSPVPVNPNPDFVAGTAINPDAVDANFRELYRALDPGQVGLDVSNLAASLVQLLHSPGDIKASGRAAPETGWLACNGGAVSRTTYAALFTAIGTTFGAGDGSTTFNLPDLAGRVPVGAGTPAGAPGATAHTMGQKAGEETHLSLSSESGVPPHTHPIFTYAPGTPNGGAIQYADINLLSGTGASLANTAQNAAAAHNNMQPYTGVNFFIKT